MSSSLRVYFGPCIDVTVSIDHKIEDHCKNHNRNDSQKFCPRCRRTKKERFQTIKTLSLNNDTNYLNSEGRETELLATFDDVSRWGFDLLGTKATVAVVNLIPSEPDYGFVKLEIEELDFFEVGITAEDIEKSLIKFECDYATELTFLRKNYKIEIKNRFISWFQ